MHRLIRLVPILKIMGRIDDEMIFAGVIGVGSIHVFNEDIVIVVIVNIRFLMEQSCLPSFNLIGKFVAA